MRSILTISLVLAAQIYAQSTSQSTSQSTRSSQSTVVLSGTNTNAVTTSVPFLGGDLLPTGSGITYLSYSTTITLSSSAITTGGNITVTSASVTASNATGSTASSSQSSTTTATATLLVGTNGASQSNATSTSTAPAATNTVPCNNYVEFCERKYSNITMVTAHNSPFVNPNNVAANQDYGVIAQLNDGVRMLQGQTHYVNGTMYYCHTSCDLLNAGTAESYFQNITTWLSAHPFDVVTILIGNGDFVNVENFTAPIADSGLAKYAYTPPKIPMALDDWPTLSSFILSGKRAIIFMDYQANQTSVPYVLDEFSQLWETPFSPTNDSFPCTVQRPPGLSDADAKNRMYMTNHNLNTEISFAGFSLLVPTTTELNITNGVSGDGSLGLTANNCLGMSQSSYNSTLLPSASKNLAYATLNSNLGPCSQLPPSRLLQQR